MSTIDTTGIEPKKKLFHNQWLDVYPTTLAIDQIHFWKENNRTIFTFQRLKREKKKKLNDLSIEEITKFVAEQDIHKIQILADSIGRSGVQVPLIVRDDEKLLDGNRRYFACQWLKMQSKKEEKEIPESLSQIPVLVIRKADLTETLELKILAEANFIADLKIPWSLDAQARAVEKYYASFRRGKKVDEEAAVDEMAEVFGIDRRRVVDLLETLQLTKRFIQEGQDQDAKIERREIVEDKFVYFWEFLNKAMKGRGAYQNPADLREVRSMFFRLMAKGQDTPIKNVKQVEPLAQAKRDPTAWRILKESKGAKLSIVVSIMNERKEVRKAEDKIRIFLAWLKNPGELTPTAKTYLREVAKLAAEMAKP